MMVRRLGVRLLPILALYRICLAWLSPRAFPAVGRNCPAIVTSTARRAVFSQPKFRNSNFTSASSPPSRPTDSTSTTRHPNSDGRIAQEHIRRIRSAGRVGTKRFVDPCRVFVGNMNFTTSEASLATFVESTLGLPAGICLNDVKVVKDWKTKASKGYGFVLFTEPVYATLFIDKGHNQYWDGRRVTVSQGAKKVPDNQVFVKKNSNMSRTGSEEERAIWDGVQGAEGHEDDGVRGYDDEELALLRLLDPDLVGGGRNEYYDSVATNSSMNRAQRRQSERERKRTKPQSKGFG